MKKIKVAIAGATGITGIELIKILAKHPGVQITHLFAQSNLGKPISFFDNKIKNTKKFPKVTSLINSDLDNIDAIFTALPHGVAHVIAKKLNKDCVLIDLSPDFRISSKTVYEEWYKVPHLATNLQKKAVYGLSEINRALIKNANIIACPGCYPTSILLPLIPLVKKKLINTNIIIADSKSGYSGAGKKIEDKKLYPNINQNLAIYGVGKHRHMPEIEQELSVHNSKKIQITFTPHLIPTFRGILSTIYLDLSKDVTSNDVYKCLKNFYIKEKFIELVTSNNMINTNRVLNTNMCNIAVYNNKFKNKIIIASAIDNLVKGAVGQAVQNFNIRYGFSETLSLI